MEINLKNVLIPTQSNGKNLKFVPAEKEVIVKEDTDLKFFNGLFHIKKDFLTPLTIDEGFTCLSEEDNKVVFLVKCSMKTYFTPLFWKKYIDKHQVEIKPVQTIKSKALQDLLVNHGLLDENILNKFTLEPVQMTGFEDHEFYIIKKYVAPVALEVSTISQELIEA